MGILLEADYKAVLSGRESVIAGLGRAFAARKAGGRRGPLEEGDTGGESDGQLTYELMNRDSGEWARCLRAGMIQEGEVANSFDSYRAG
jgi:hypothetical protein